MTLKGDAKFKGKLTCGLKNDISSLLHLMGAIPRTHASTRVTSLMCVKNSMRHFCL